jgi:hypothetical protein
MIDFKEQGVRLRQLGFMKGQRPLFIKILKGSYPFKGKYIFTITNESINFYQLKHNYNYKGKKAVDFLILFSNLVGFRFSFYKKFYRKITLIFKDDLEFEFIYMCDRPEAYDNEPIAKFFMQTLKDKGILQRNNIKGGKRGQKVISKRDQLFTKEIRSTSKKRGFFG